MRCPACREKMPKYERYCPKCGEANPWMIGRTVEQVKRKNLVDWLVVLVPITVVLVGCRLIRWEMGEGLAMMATLFLVVICPIHFIRRYRNRPDRVEYRRKRAAKKRAAHRQAKPVRSAPRIEYTQILCDHTRASISSAIGRGLVGTLFGPGGTAVGIATAKKTGTVTFDIWFADGSQNRETVRVNSPRYEELIRYLDF